MRRPIEPTPPTPPLALTNSELDIIMRHAAPLAPSDRRSFVETVVRALRGVEPGPGSIARACRQAQHAFINRAVGIDRQKGEKYYPPKYSRPSQNGGRKRQEG